MVSAVAMVCATVPLAWRRTLPLLPVVAVALTLIGDEALGGFLVGHTATPVVALAVALYSAGRHVATVRGLAAAAAGVVVLSAIRVTSDPAVDDAAQAVLTLVAVSLPLLVGRWVRGQALLQGALSRTAARLARDRERDARRAAGPSACASRATSRPRSPAACARSPPTPRHFLSTCEPATTPPPEPCSRAAPPRPERRSPTSAACSASSAARASRSGSTRPRTRPPPSTGRCRPPPTIPRVAVTAATASCDEIEHAPAGRARVMIRYDRRAVELEVADDGRGRAPGRAARNGAAHGLVGMREGPALSGGPLDAGPGPGVGFRVHARLPIT